MLLIPAVLILKKKYTIRTGYAWVAIIHKQMQPSVMKQYSAPVLAGGALVLIVVAIANIQYSTYWKKTYLESKWIMLVQDLSGSMGRPSDEFGRMTLGDVALEGAHAFIDMRSKDDLIGIIAFSNVAQVIAPPSFDKHILTQKLELLSRKRDSVIFRALTVGGATNASYAAWLAVCVFFMLLPEENQPSYEQINDLRFSLMGATAQPIDIPEKLKKINFGQGMAIVLFTDGRIEANNTADDAQKGLLNFIRVINLIKQLGIRLYLIAVGGEVNSDVRFALEGPAGDVSAGHIFYMPRTFDIKKITAVYNEINTLEKNRLLVTLEKRKRDTRWFCAILAACLLAGYCFLATVPSFRKI